MKTLGYLTLHLLALTVNLLWGGYVLTLLWQWFIVSQFSGVPRLSIAGAIGITIIMAALTHQRIHRLFNEHEDDGEILMEIWLDALFLPLVMLVCGAIVHMFME